MRNFTTKTKITFALFLLISLLSIQYYKDQNHKSSKKMSLPNQIIDPYQHLHIIPNPNGTITRLTEFYPSIPPSVSSSLTLSKDVSMNSNNGTWVRIFLPRTAINRSHPPNRKLPYRGVCSWWGVHPPQCSFPCFSQFLLRVDESTQRVGHLG